MNNHVMLVGHVGAPPETREFEKTGSKLCSFSLAVKMLAGSEKERTVWFKVKAWGPVAERVEKYVTRGREIVVTGQLDIETYTNDNGRQEKPAIRLSTFHLCGKKPESADKADETLPEAEEQAMAVAEASEKPRRKKSAA